MGHRLRRGAPRVRQASRGAPARSGGDSSQAGRPSSTKRSRACSGASRKSYSATMRGPGSPATNGRRSEPAAGGPPREPRAPSLVRAGCTTRRRPASEVARSKRYGYSWGCRRHEPSEWRTRPATGLLSHTAISGASRTGSVPRREKPLTNPPPCGSLLRHSAPIRVQQGDGLRGHHEVGDACVLLWGVGEVHVRGAVHHARRPRRRRVASRSEGVRVDSPGERREGADA